MHQRTHRILSAAADRVRQQIVTSEGVSPFLLGQVRELLLLAEAEHVLAYHQPEPFGRVEFGASVVAGRIELLPAGGVRVAFEDDEQVSRVLDIREPTVIDWMSDSVFDAWSRRRVVHAGLTGYEVHPRRMSPAAATTAPRASTVEAGEIWKADESGSLVPIRKGP